MTPVLVFTIISEFYLVVIDSTSLFAYVTITIIMLCLALPTMFATVIYVNNVTVVVRHLD